MPDKNNASPSLNLRKDATQAINDVNKAIDEARLDFQKEVEKVSGVSRDIRAFDGDYHDFTRSARILAKASIRAEVASAVGVFTNKDGATDEDRLMSIALQVTNATSGSLSVIKLNINQNSDPGNYYLGFDEFAEYEHVVKLSEWRKYLDLITE